MRRLGCTIAVAFGNLLCGGCSTVPAPPPDAPADTAWPAGLQLLTPDPDLPPMLWSHLRSGQSEGGLVNPVADLEGTGWPSDRGIRYEVEVWDGETRRHHFALDVNALGASGEDSSDRRMTVTLTTMAGRESTVASRSASVMAWIQGPTLSGDGAGLEFVNLPRDFLEAGFVAACETALLLEAQKPQGSSESVPSGLPPTDEELRPLLMSLGGMISLLDLVQSQEVLREVLFDLVDAPSVWSVITNLGVSVSVTPGFSSAWQPEGAPTEALGLGPCWAFPVALLANGQPALDMVWYVVAPQGPLTIGGGVIAITGRDPGDPNRRLVISLSRAWKMRTEGG